MSCGAFRVVDPGDGGLDLVIEPVMSPEQEAEFLRWVDGESDQPPERVRRPVMTDRECQEGVR